MAMYTWLCLKQKTSRSYCTAQESLLIVTWQAGWEWGVEDNEYVQMYGRVPLQFTENYHDVVNQLYSNTKEKVKKIFK